MKKKLDIEASHMNWPESAEASTFLIRSVFQENHMICVNLFVRFNPNHLNSNVLFSITQRTLGQDLAYDLF